MHALDVLGEPVRRHILELLLAEGESSAGEIVSVIQAATGISQPAVSQHLRVLREHGFVTVRAAGTRRYYQLQTPRLAEAWAWLGQFLHNPWASPFAALGTEVARGQRDRREAVSGDGPDDRNVLRKDLA